MLKELIPAPQQKASVFFDECLNSSDFTPVEPAAFMQPDRIKPEFGFVGVSLNVNMGRLDIVTRV
jgi:hypothetical protein